MADNYSLVLPDYWTREERDAYEERAQSFLETFPGGISSDDPVVIIANLQVEEFWGEIVAMRRLLHDIRQAVNHPRTSNVLTATVMPAPKL